MFFQVIGWPTWILIFPSFGRLRLWPVLYDPSCVHQGSTRWCTQKFYRVPIEVSKVRSKLTTVPCQCMHRPFLSYVCKAGCPSRCHRQATLWTSAAGSLVDPKFPNAERGLMSDTAPYHSRKPQQVNVTTQYHFRNSVRDPIAGELAIPLRSAESFRRRLR